MATTTTTTKKINSMILVLVFMVLSGCCTATVYKVGDSDGLSPKDDGYYEWAKYKQFYVGDSLVFEYDPKVNDVTQVSGALEYEFCEPSSPKAVYHTGNDVVTFTEPGPYYLISSNLAQCALGQKLDILPLGKIFNIGDSNGWKIPDDGEFYYKWSQEKQFQVGHNLFLEYDQEANDILEISGDLEFLSCDPTSPVAVHKTVMTSSDSPSQESTISSAPKPDIVRLDSSFVSLLDHEYSIMFPIPSCLLWTGLRDGYGLSCPTSTKQTSRSILFLLGLIEIVA